MSYYEFPHTRTYDSDLGWLIKEFKHITEEVTALKQDIIDINTDLKTVYNKIDILNSDIQALNAKIDSDIKDLDDKYANIILAIKSELSHLSIKVNNILPLLQDMINAEHFSMINYVNARLAAFIASLPDYSGLIVYNPVRGINTNVQTAINDLYGFFNAYGLTAEQYDSLGLSASEYDAYGLTAILYDSEGYNLLGYPDPRYIMRNPFNGLLEPISKVVNMLFHLHYPGMTAQDYDDLELAASYYDSLLLSAFDYDAYGIV